MRTALRQPRARGVRRLAVAVALPLLVLGLAACEPTPQQAEVHHLVDQARVGHGLPALEDHLTVRAKAQQWAEHLASRGTLAHSNLAAGLEDVPWTAIGENVGVGAGVSQVHHGYMHSPGHKANILDGRWDVVGTGHAVGGDGQVYTVQVFVALR